MTTQAGIDKEIKKLLDLVSVLVIVIVVMINMNEQIKKLLDKGYSHCAIAMHCGGPVGTPAYYKVLNELDPHRPIGCPHCGELCFGTGDCNCRDD
jgi:hypothetical protein